MAEALLELLTPYFDPAEHSPSRTSEDVTAKYLNRLSTLPLNALTSTEHDSLNQSAHSNDISLQALSARSNAAIVTSSDHLASLSKNLPRLAERADALREDVPKLDQQAVQFSEKYSRSTENEVLERRKMSLLMARNVDRLSDILDLPTLLSSTIASSTAQAGAGATNYAAALDLHSHIKRLSLLHQQSDVVASIYKQTEEAMQEMTSHLISSLRSQSIKMAAGMRTVGWLRRVAPELDGHGANEEGSLGSLFLVSRLTTLLSMLSALEPLRDLADQETALRKRAQGKADARGKKDAWTHGQQTERFLKRYIEIFREQSFAIVSMYKSIFPSKADSNASDDFALRMKSMNLKSVQSTKRQPGNQPSELLMPVPSALATFPDHLVTLLSSTLQQYLPNVRDKASRESLLTQVLYCAGSLGRLGGDFSMLLAFMTSERGTYDDEDVDSEQDEVEWISVMKKHRELASKLEKLASGAS